MRELREPPKGYRWAKRGPAEPGVEDGGFNLEKIEDDDPRRIIDYTAEIAENDRDAT